MTSKNIFKIAFAIDAILLALSLFVFFNFSDGVPFHFNHKGESRLLLPRISSFAHFAISISITLFLLLIAKFSTSFAKKKALRHYYAPVAATVLPKDKTIALYCRSGRRSKTAATTLAKKNYNVVELSSGCLGWTGSNKPVTTK